MFDTKISLYAIMITASLLSNIIIVFTIYKKFGFSRDEIIGAIIYENTGIIMGAKLLTYLQNYSYYKDFNLMQVGFSSYGGVIGAIICLIVFGIQFKKNIKNMLFTFMPSIPLMYAVGKVGCFFSGCCYGINYDGPGNIIYHYTKSGINNVKIFPVQIAETFVFSIIFIYMINKIQQNKFDWDTLGKSFILCGLAKFGLDFLRANNAKAIITVNQAFSMVFIIIGILIYLIFRNKKEMRKKDEV